MARLPPSSVVCEDPGCVVALMHGDARSPQTARRVVTVAPQADEVAMELQEPGMTVALAPVEGLLVGEPGALD